LPSAGPDCAWAVVAEATAPVKSAAASAGNSRDVVEKWTVKARFPR